MIRVKTEIQSLLGTLIRKNNAIYGRRVREEISYLNLALKDEQEFAKLEKGTEDNS